MMGQDRMRQDSKRKKRKGIGHDGKGKRKGGKQKDGTGQNRKGKKRKRQDRMETNITEKGRERTGQDETYMYSMELDRWDRKEIEGTDGMRRKEMDETRQEV